MWTERKQNTKPKTTRDLSTTIDARPRTESRQSSASGENALQRIRWARLQLHASPVPPHEPFNGRRAKITPTAMAPMASPITRSVRRAVCIGRYSIPAEGISDSLSGVDSMAAARASNAGVERLSKPLGPWCTMK